MLFYIGLKRTKKITYYIDIDEKIRILPKFKRKRR